MGIKMKNLKTDKKRSILPEVLIVGLLFVVMTAIRVMYINGHEINGAGFYELCRIQIGTQLPYLEYGVGDLYAKLLHLLFWLMGNHMLLAAYLQLVLQMTAMVLFYFAIRRLWGFIPAFAVETALFVFPEFLESLVILNQKNLLLLILCINLAAVSALLGRAVYGRMAYGWYMALLLLTGLLGGISVYMDKLYLAVPAVALAALLTAKRKRRRLQIPLYLTGLGLGFGISLFAKRQISGMQYMAVWAEYDRAQTAGGLFYGKGAANYAAAILLYTIFAVAAAGFILYSYRRKEQIMPKVKEDIQIKEIESFEAPEPEVKKPTVNYIENPLPLPKKHVRKEMDFNFEPEPSMMKYDLPVPDSDDFDIP